MRVIRNHPKRYIVPLLLPDNPHCSELTVKKSVFLAQSCHCESAAQARDFIAQIRSKYPDASHNCWAFNALAPGETGISGSSDDGEPHGTAGRPILQCLLGSGLGEICMVVTRWFGGIKLGTAGLARAYQQAALDNLCGVPRQEKIPYERWHFNLDYSSLESVKRYLQNIGARIEAEEYGAKVNLQLKIPCDRVNGLREAVAGISNGRAMLRQVPDDGILA